MAVTPLAERARTTSDTKNTVMRAKGRVTAMAVERRILISGSGLSIRITAPRILATVPPRASTPCDANLASSTKKVNARNSSVAPSQLMGSMERADRPNNTMPLHLKLLLTKRSRCLVPAVRHEGGGSQAGEENSTAQRSLKLSPNDFLPGAVVKLLLRDG